MFVFVLFCLLQIEGWKQIKYIEQSIDSYERESYQHLREQQDIGTVAHWRQWLDNDENMKRLEYCARSYKQLKALLRDKRLFHSCFMNKSDALGTMREFWQELLFLRGDRKFTRIMGSVTDPSGAIELDKLLEQIDEAKHARRQYEEAKEKETNEWNKRRLEKERAREKEMLARLGRRQPSAQARARYAYGTPVSMTEELSSMWDTRSDDNASLSDYHYKHN